MYNCIPGQKIVKQREESIIGLDKYLSPTEIHLLDVPKQQRAHAIIKSIQSMIDVIPMQFIGYKLRIVDYISAVLKNRDIGEREIRYHLITRDAGNRDNSSLVNGFLDLLTWRRDCLENN